MSPARVSALLISPARVSALLIALLLAASAAFPVGRAVAPAAGIPGFAQHPLPVATPFPVDAPDGATGSTVGVPPAQGPADAPVPPESPAEAPQQPVASTTQPNIIVFYIDDVGPHDGRLWNDPALTPALHEYFVARGINLTNAIGETPLCCPGRAGLLTGLHTHNHGVTINDARLLDPAEHVGAALKRAGYRSLLIGKYLNKPDLLSPYEWSRHGSGWTEFDVFRNKSGETASNYFYDYRMYTKQGDVAYGKHHSNRMIAERTIARLRQAPADTPVFALVSMYAPHAPGTPMPEFVKDPRCAVMPPWKPPNYNEADVSDKHPALQKLKLLPNTAGWPMVKLCEQMLGVDWVVRQVTDELAAQGRLDNSLLVFTADNGMAWGQHRLGADKQWPYTTPVPLFMSWPARWGNEPREVDEVVSNIDLAPTLCEVAGCSMGPYPGGQPSADGISILPVLDGPATSLGRDAVLEANMDKAVFYSLRTSPSNPLGLWHYVEWGDGFRELYDLVADPWHLENRAADPALADVRAALSSRLAELKVEGLSSAAAPRPDGSIALKPSGKYKGNLLYLGAPHKKQTQRRDGVARNKSYNYSIRIRNRGQGAGAFQVYGLSTGSTAMTARYLVNGVDETAAVVNGSYTTAGLAPGAFMTVTVRITVAPGAPSGIKHHVVVRVSPVGHPLSVDVLRAIATR